MAKYELTGKLTLTNPSVLGLEQGDYVSGDILELSEEQASIGFFKNKLKLIPMPESAAASEAFAEIEAQKVKIAEKNAQADAKLEAAESTVDTASAMLDEAKVKVSEMLKQAQAEADAILAGALERAKAKGKGTKPEIAASNEGTIEEPVNG